jgi:hypothetical protein
MPYGLRFSADGSMVCVADKKNGRVCAFRVGDGAFLQHIATGLREPTDVEEVEGGWLVACQASNSLVVARRAGGTATGSGTEPTVTCAGPGEAEGELHWPSGLAVVPGLGLVVREVGNVRMQVVSLRDSSGSDGYL